MNDYSTSAASGAFMGLFSLFYFAVVILMIVSGWKIFEKAGEPGWQAIIPIYNFVVLMKIIGKPWWWLLLLMVPIANIYVAVMSCYLLAKSFGKDVGFAIGLFFLGFIFGPMLAFGKDRYIGPGGVGPDVNQTIGSIGLS